MADLVVLDGHYDFPGDANEAVIGGVALELRDDRPTAPLKLLDEQDWGWPESQSDFVQGRETEGGLKVGEEVRNRAIRLAVLLSEPEEFYPTLGDRVNVATNFLMRPSAETQGGQVTGSGGTVARTREVEAYAGDSVRSITTTTTTNGGFLVTPTGLVANTWYAWTLAFWPLTIGQPMRLQIQWRDSGNNVISSVNKDFTPTEAKWQVIGMKALAPAGTASANASLRLNNASTNIVFYVDLLTFTDAWYPGNVTDPYPNYIPEPFDGDSPGCAWTGTRDDSSSTRPASGGPRFDSMLADLDAKLAKMKREGGTLRRRTQSGRMAVYDVQDATREGAISGEAMRGYFQGKYRTTLEFTALPYGRGPHRSAAAPATNTAARWAELIVPAIGGDSPALLVVKMTNTNASQPIRHISAGSQVRNYSSDPLARIHYEAEELTAIGDTVRSNAPTWASSESGATAKVLRQQNLSPSWKALMSTRIRSAADYPGTTGTANKNLKHVGAYLVRARVMDFSPGRTEFTFEYRVGESSSWERLDVVKPVASEGNGACLIDFGVMTIEKMPTVGSATHQWEGRLLARTDGTVFGEDCDVDYIEFLPVDECFFECRAPAESISADAIYAEDAFTYSDNPAVNLSTKGWTTAGTADGNDFTVGTGHSNRARRAYSPFNAQAARRAKKGADTSNDLAVKVDWRYLVTSGALTFETIIGGPAIIGSAGASLVAGIGLSNAVGGGLWELWIADVTAAMTSFTKRAAVSIPGGILPDTPYTLQAVFRHSPNVVDLWFGPRDSTLTRMFTRFSVASLAVGQPLASGAPGQLDYWTSPSAGNAVVNRDFDAFQAWEVPSIENVVNPNSKVAEFRHDGAFRESAADTTLWTPMTPEGDRPRVWPAGHEGRPARVYATAAPADPAVEGDLSTTAPFNLEARWTPRYLGNPDEAT